MPLCGESTHVPTPVSYTHLDSNGYFTTVGVRYRLVSSVNRFTEKEATMQSNAQKRRSAMLDYISSYWTENGIAPTVRDIQEALSLIHI